MPGRSSTIVDAHRRRRLSRRPVAVALAAVALVLAAGMPIAPASAGISTPAAAALTITPNTLLLNNQFVTAAGTGYPVGTQVGIVQCKTDPGGPQGCDLSTLAYATSDGGGAFSVGFKVKRVIRVGPDSIDCATAGACIIGAGVPPDGIPAANAAIQFDPSVPLPPPPSLTVDPDSDLVDRQAVTVTGNNYEPFSSVGVVQCRAPSSGAEDCDLSTLQFISPADDGSFTLSFTVRRLIRIEGQTLDCAQPGLCEIGAGSGIDNGAQAAIQFDPDQPLPPPPALTVTPSTGLVDGQTVVVTGSGFPTGTNGVVQCAAFVTSPDADACLISNVAFPSVGPDGSFSAELVVEEVMDLTTADIDCRPAGSCVIFSSSFADASNGVAVPISFGSPGPNGPSGENPAPEPGPLVTPRFTG